MTQTKLAHPVFLCGMMGSGKSTIGKNLSDALGISFTDLDRVIEEDEGMSIPEIFSKKQESGFRKIERKTLVKLAKNAKGIIALGGGSLQNQQIVDHVKLYGWLVYINASREEILGRLDEPAGRPMLQETNTKSVGERIDALFEERMVFYEQAHFSVQTEKKSIGEIVNEIIKKLTIYEGRHHS